MEQAIADGVGDGRIAEMVVPLRDGDLAGEERGSVAVAVLDDLEEIPALEVADWRHPPVVEDEHVDAGKAREQPRIGAIGTSKRQLVEEARDAAVQGSVALATGLLRERRREIGLADAGGSGDMLGLGGATFSSSVLAAGGSAFFTNSVHQARRGDYSFGEAGAFTAGAMAAALPSVIPTVTAGMSASGMEMLLLGTAEGQVMLGTGHLADEIVERVYVNCGQ